MGGMQRMHLQPNQHDPPSICGIVGFLYNILLCRANAPAAMPSAPRLPFLPRLPLQHRNPRSS